MHLLRDRKALTRLLILMEIMERRPTRIKTVADAMEMSVQGASDHLNEMEDEGLVARLEGVFRPTTQGIQFLHEGFSRLRDFVGDKGRSLDIVGSCLARAGNSVREGDPVGLVMEDGELRAFSGKAEASTGVARSTGKKGEVVLVGELSGVLDLKPGNVHLFRVEHTLEGGKGGTMKVELPVAKARKALAGLKPDMIGAAGVSARALVDRLGKKADFTMAPGAAALEAAGKGYTVLVFVSAEDAEQVLGDLEKHRAGGPGRVDYSWV